MPQTTFQVQHNQIMEKTDFKESRRENATALPQPAIKILINGTHNMNFYHADDILPDSFSKNYKFQKGITVTMQSAN